MAVVSVTELTGSPSLTDDRKSYAQLEAELTALRKAFYEAAESYPAQHIMPPAVWAWWQRFYDAVEASSTEVK